RREAVLMMRSHTYGRPSRAGAPTLPRQIGSYPYSTQIAKSSTRLQKRARAVFFAADAGERPEDGRGKPHALVRIVIRRCHRGNVARLSGRGAGGADAAAAGYRPLSRRPAD